MTASEMTEISNELRQILKFIFIDQHDFSNLWALIFKIQSLLGQRFQNDLQESLKNIIIDPAIPDLLFKPLSNLYGILFSVCFNLKWAFNNIMKILDDQYVTKKELISLKSDFHILCLHLKDQLIESFYNFLKEMVKFELNDA